MFPLKNLACKGLKVNEYYWLFCVGVVSAGCPNVDNVKKHKNPVCEKYTNCHKSQKILTFFLSYRLSDFHVTSL